MFPSKTHSNACKNTIIQSICNTIIQSILYNFQIYFKQNIFWWCICFFSWRVPIPCKILVLHMEAMHYHSGWHTLGCLAGSKGSCSLFTVWFQYAVHSASLHDESIEQHPAFSRAVRALSVNKQLKTVYGYQLSIHVRWEGKGSCVLYLKYHS